MIPTSELSPIDLSLHLPEVLPAARVMTDEVLPDKDGWEVVVETSINGCVDPKGEGGEAPTDVDSCSSTYSSSSGPEKDVGDPNAIPSSEESNSLGLDDENDSLPPDYYSYETFTHSPPLSNGRKRRKTKPTCGNDTPPSSPSLVPTNGTENNNKNPAIPRSKENDILDLENLKGLFPHWSEEELQKIVPTCERYRDGDDPFAQDLDDTESNNND